MVIIKLFWSTVLIEGEVGGNPGLIKIVDESICINA